MNFISYAQNYEDVMLWRALQHVEKGFYVDVGANDPIEDSLTQAFYERGWSGINIEPVTEWYEKLSAERQRDINLKVAAGDCSGEIDLFEVVGTGLSTANETYANRHATNQGFEIRKLRVPVRTLDSIFRECDVTDVHFLKIDVEGSEQAVLRGLDLVSVRPWIILVEATQPQTEILDYQRWEPMITKKGYQFVYFDGLNRFYVADEHAELADVFKVPPNYWDRYERLSQYRARKQVDVLTAQLKEKEADIRSREADIRSREADIQSKEANIRSKEADIRSIEKALGDLLNSRSMKVTAPLRKILDLSRRAKHVSKRIPQKIVRTAAAKPQLRRVVKPLVNRFPAIQYRLSYLLHQESRLSLASLEQLNSGELSPRAARILKDLKRVTN